jgi:broad specificity phosphatase PhoE
VVLIRHTITTPGAGDPPGMRLDDCSTQRNLTGEGRRHARRIGEDFRSRGVPVERVLSSPWCRRPQFEIQTARLAFGKAETSEPLSNLYGRGENRERQVREMRAMVAETPRGGNLVLVSHGFTILALTGISPQTGEMVIVTPQGEGRFALAGRLAVEER